MRSYPWANGCCSHGSIFLCVTPFPKVIFFIHNNTLFHIYILRKNLKNCRKLYRKKKSSKITIYTIALKKGKTNKPTDSELKKKCPIIAGLSIKELKPSLNFNEALISFLQDFVWDRRVLVASWVWSFPLMGEHSFLHLVRVDTTLL